MLRIGLTGGIGSGKTTVAGIFEVLGIPVYYADNAARKMMAENADLKTGIIQHFGAESYAGGTLNRSYLAAVIFSDAEKTERMNSIIHPAAMADAAAWMKLQNSPYALKEAALIFEAGAEKELDLVIGVSAPAELRVSRAMLRDGITEEAVRLRMARQMDENEKLRRCDFVLENDEKQLLIPQVLAVHEKILAKLK